MAHIERRVRCRTCGGPFMSGSCQKCGRQAGQMAYRARYIDPTGRERSRSFSRKVDAERFLTTVESGKLQGTWTDPARGKVTFAAWLETWWTTAADLRPSTRARDRSYFNSLILPRFGAAPLAAITQPSVQAWVADLLARGLAAETVVKAYQLLGRTMTAAVNADMLARSPCRAVRLPKIERQEMRFLTPAEVARLADAIGPRYRALVLLAAYGGLRIGELAGLRRSRVNLLRGTVDVAEIVVEVKGKLFIGPPKTRAGRRTIGLPQAVVDELATHLGPLGSADAHVFTSDKGGILRTSNFRAKVWLPAVRAAGLAPLRPHDLRHTAVALWIAAGANPKEVSVRAGHTSVAFTLDRYGHLFEGHDLELRDRLDIMLAEGLKEAAATESVVPLRSVSPSQDDGPETAQGNPSNEEDPAVHRVSPAGFGGAPPGTRTPNRCLKRALLCQLS
jgi:integrase